jgi:hypothetical protein
MTLLNRWKFTILLTTLLLLIVVHPLVNEGDAFAPGLYAFFLIAAFLGMILVLFQRRGSRIAALVLGIPSVVGLLTHFLVPGLPPVFTSLLFHLVPVVFLVFTVVTILQTIFVARRVSADAINGALGGYLLIALAFGHLYCLAESLRPGSFHMASHFAPLVQHEDRRHAVLTYFSLITLTTLGYGDITPQSAPARTLTWMEAVVGQFYVAVIIAQLIGLKVSSSLRDEKP